MVIAEVFPNPTVKQVIFQVRFPSLFYMEGKIGDLQLKLMSSFPKTSLVLRQQVVVADLGSQVNPEGVPMNLEKEASKKIWRFESPDNVELNILDDSLDISSRFHKTYNLGEGPKFRDAIQLVVDSFLGVIPLPLFTRIGLRYVDECPIPSMDNDSFATWYNTTWPLNRFDLRNTQEMKFVTVQDRDSHSLRYVEMLIKGGDQPKLLLDFDGFAKDVRCSDYLAVTDKLHDIIAEEYEKTLKAPVFDYMRQGG